MSKIRSLRFPFQLSSNSEIYSGLYILPPLTLSSTTTVTFPPFTTSLEVAWKTSSVITVDGQASTSTGYDRIIQTTVLTIPPVTTDRIDLWNVNITAGVQSSVIQITRSILPPPFTITDDQNPLSQDGVTHPPVTRTITPPPFPYPKSERVPIPRTLDSTSPGRIPTGSSTSPGAFPAGSSTSTRSHPITATSGSSFPYPTTSGYYYPPQDTCTDCHDVPVTHSSGHPKTPCKTGCGHPCNPAVGLAAGIPLIGGVASAAAAAALCNHPCYMNCADLGGFVDPIDPDPPAGLTPDDFGSQGPGPDPDDPNDPESETTSSCSTSVVTDYYVSCTSLTSGSVSCKTTSSSLSRGCDITASATTTSASNCPLVTDNPDEDEGEDGAATLPSVSGRSTTTTTVEPVVTKFTPLPTSKPHSTTTKTVEGTTTVVVPAPSLGPYQPRREYVIGYWTKCVESTAEAAHAIPCIDQMYWGILVRGADLPKNDHPLCNPPDTLTLILQLDRVPVTRGWPMFTEEMDWYIGPDPSPTRCDVYIENNSTVAVPNCQNLNGLLGPKCSNTSEPLYPTVTDNCGPGWDWVTTNICEEVPQN